MIKLSLISIFVAGLLGCQSLQRGSYILADGILPGSVVILSDGSVCTKSSIRGKVTCNE